MAIGAGTVWELNASGGNAANGSGFDTSNANFPTDGTTDTNTGNTNSPVFSSASYNFVAGDVGAWIYIKSGTNSIPGWYQIASVASNKATLSAAIGQGIVTDSTVGYPTPMYKTNSAAGIATVGTPTSLTYGVDYSQSTTSITNNTDLASTNGTTNPSTCTSAGSPFGVNHTGNFFRVSNGTNFTGAWYEVVSVSGTTATLDKALGSAASLSGGTFRLGGAQPLNHASEDLFFETGVAGNRYFVKNGSYTLNSGFLISAAGGTQNPIIMEGYNSLRGDAPLGSSRPTFAAGANSCTWGANWDVYFLILTTSTAAGFTLGGSGKLISCKGTNASTTSSRVPLTLSSNSIVFKCEAISYRGRGISQQSGNSIIIGCYFHDSDMGITIGIAGNTQCIAFNIFESMVTTAINASAGVTGGTILLNNTLFGSTNTTGTGINLATGTTNIRVIGNIISGFATGISHADSGQVVGFSDYNAMFNNDTDTSNWVKGTHSTTSNPTFSNESQVTGTAGKYAAGNNVIIDTTQNFTTAGVVANQDYIYIVSGTGVTAGQYSITGISTTTNPNDTLTITPAPGTNTTADKVYQITIGHNLAVGANMKAASSPGNFPESGPLTVGYLDIGAVQRQEPTLASTFS